MKLTLRVKLIQIYVSQVCPMIHMMHIVHLVKSRCFQQGLISASNICKCKISKFSSTSLFQSNRLRANVIFCLCLQRSARSRSLRKYLTRGLSEIFTKPIPTKTILSLRMFFERYYFSFCLSRKNMNYKNVFF